MDSLVRPDFCNMPKKKTSIEIATGKLISSIQKEWGEELGESNVEASEDVMDRGHNLLQAAKNYLITYMSKLLLGAALPFEKTIPA